jgi:hypothetical protein
LGGFADEGIGGFDDLVDDCEELVVHGFPLS